VLPELNAKSNAKSNAKGRHVLADFHGVSASLLKDVTNLERNIRKAAACSGATVLSCHFHRFGEGLGVTGVALLAESHISIHTWPELEFAALDVYMCGALDPNLAIEYLVQELKPSEHQIKCIDRGVSR
jgi:S-adenosylmethionine decarboxylase